MTFNELAKQRYSCRKISAKPASLHTLRKSVSEIVKEL